MELGERKGTEMATMVVEKTVNGNLPARIEVGTDEHGYAYAVSLVNGEQVGGRQETVVKLNKALGGGTLTHYVGKVALTTAEAEAVTRALTKAGTAARAAIAAATLAAARAIYPDAIIATRISECGMTNRMIGPGTPITKTECGWSIADQRTRDAEMTGKGRRWDWLSRAQNQADSIY